METTVCPANSPVCCALQAQFALLVRLAMTSALPILVLTTVQVENTPMLLQSVSLVLHLALIAFSAPPNAPHASPQIT